MHRHGIVHRDLKLENWLMQTPGDTTGVKLIDFGLSKHFDVDKSMQQAVGSTYYVAPGKRALLSRSYMYHIYNIYTVHQVPGNALPF